MQFQKKKQGLKKKKKKGKSEKSGASGTGSDASAASGNVSQSEGRKSANGEHLEASEGSKPDEFVPVKDDKLGRKDEDAEEVSQADTDQDAPSIASEAASPIPFDVSFQVLHFDPCLVLV